MTGLVLPERLGLRPRMRAYVEIGRIAFATRLVYRADFLVSAVVLLIQIFVLRVIWTAVYADRASVPGSGGAGQIALSTQIAYVSLAAIQFWLFTFWGLSSIPQRVREGKIAVDLCRPVGLLHQAVAGCVGATAAMLPFAVLALPFALLVGGAAPPASLAALAGYVASLAAAFAVATQLNVIQSMVAFWTLEITGYGLAYRVIAQFLAGALVPLWFMPGWLRGAAEVLPFQAMTYTPVAVYLGQIHGAGIWFALAVQAFWIVALWLLLRLVWSRALRRVVVQGG